MYFLKFVFKTYDIHIWYCQRKMLINFEKGSPLSGSLCLRNAGLKKATSGSDGRPISAMSRLSRPDIQLLRNKIDVDKLNHVLKMIQIFFEVVCVRYWVTLGILSVLTLSFDPLSR